MSVDRFSPALERVLFRLKDARRSGQDWRARCPAHDDAHPSLSVRASDDGTVLLKCHAGCPTEQVVQALGLTLADLFPPSAQPPRRLVKAYDYYDEHGRHLYQVLRYDPKSFCQRRLDERGNFVYRIGNTPRTLYRLRELIKATPETRIFIVEGEKDADALAARGLVGTTNAGGAGKWLDSYSHWLQGRRVVVLPDNDEPGRQHARRVVESALPVATELRVLELPGLQEHGDVSDWLRAGGSRDELLRQAEAAPLAADWLKHAPEAETPRTTRLDTVTSRAVRWLWEGWLASGKLAILDGDPGLGKSTLTLALIAALTTAGRWPDGSAAPFGNALVINGEDGPEDTLRPRLEAAGADLKRVHLLRGPLCHGHERMPCFPQDLDHLADAVRDCQPALVVLDPLVAFLDETINSAIDQSVRRALALLATLAEEHDCAILLVRHLNKSNSGKALYRGGGSIGLVGACRTAWLLAADPNDPEQRVLAQVKNNLAPLQPSLIGRVVSADGRSRLEWRGPVELTANQLLGATGPVAPAEPRRDGRAVELLREALRHGPRLVKEVEAELEALGVSRSAIHRAAEGLVVKHLPAKGRPSCWSLREEATPPPTPPPPASVQQQVLPLGDWTPTLGPYAPGH